MVLGGEVASAAGQALTGILLRFMIFRTFVFSWSARMNH